MMYTGYCLNTGDGDGGGSGGLYHLSYGIASIRGVKAWLEGCMEGCTMQELRNSAGGGEALATFLRHEDWDMLPVAKPGAPPVPPVPSQVVAIAAGADSGAGTNASSSGAPGGEDQASATGSGGGMPIEKTDALHKCGEFGVRPILRG